MSENQEPDSEGAAGLAGCTWTPILIRGWVSAVEGAEGEYACLRELWNWPYYYVEQGDRRSGL